MGRAVALGPGKLSVFPASPTAKVSISHTMEVTCVHSPCQQEQPFCKPSKLDKVGSMAEYPEMPLPEMEKHSSVKFKAARGFQIHTV